MSVSHPCCLVAPATDLSSCGRVGAHVLFAVSCGAYSATWHEFPPFTVTVLHA